MVELIFTKDEKIFIEEALNTYSESQNPISRFPLREELKQPLIDSALQKLDCLNVFTSFTKNESSVMLLAMGYIRQISDISGIDITDPAFHSAIMKLGDLLETYNQMGQNSL